MRIGVERLAVASATLVCVELCAIAPSAANQQPAGINLGATSFLDGFGPPTGGFTYQAYLTFGTSSAIYDGNGDEVPVFVDPRISTFALVNQLTYFLPETLFEDAVRPGINFILPLVGFMTMPGDQLSFMAGDRAAISGRLADHPGRHRDPPDLLTVSGST
jgi:hypothetical protein